MTPLADRFWAKVNKGLGCWGWTGSRCPKGYGKIQRGPTGQGTVLVHRLSWELANGPVPDGLWVLHKCDNASCVNPDHLWLGTARDNFMDCLRKGRRPLQHGARCHFARLDWPRVTAIRSLLVAGASGRSLAKQYGVAEATIRALRHGRSWKQA